MGPRTRSLHSNALWIEDLKLPNFFRLRFPMTRICLAAIGPFDVGGISANQ